jgi:hypothetical protein
MNDEGELKKQIRANTCGVHGFENIYLNAENEQRGLLEILDEAKKEFPNIDDEKYGSDSKRWIPWNYSAFNRDLLDWYAKWFGENSVPNHS